METNVGFTQIGLTAALILNRLRNQAQLTKQDHPQENEEGAANNKNPAGEQEQPDEHRRYVEQRLRELAIWERRLKG
jgi:hypothetical protein